MTNPYAPTFTEEHQTILNRLENFSLKKGREKGYGRVPSDLSIFATLHKHPHVINRLSQDGVDAKHLYQELHYEYMTLRYKVSTPNEGEEWKDPSETPIIQDIEFLTTLSTHLNGDDNGGPSTENRVYSGFCEYLLQIPQNQWTMTLQKYLISKQTRCIYTSPAHYRTLDTQKKERERESLLKDQAKENARQVTFFTRAGTWLDEKLTALKGQPKSNNTPS